jgi:mono/diheme cytochrome c family protein
MLAAASLALGLVAAQPGHADGKKGHHPSAEPGSMLEQMRDMHKGHEHMHDFEAIDALPPEEMTRAMNAMMDIGLVVPAVDSHKGRELFVEKGCIVCHQVNGVGGEVGPSLNAADMPARMNAFEFAARMWRGAGAMIQMQQELFGDQIELTGQDLANLVAFAHDREEQQELAQQDLPQKFKDLIDQ